MRIKRADGQPGGSCVPYCDVKHGPDYCPCDTVCTRVLLGGGFGAAAAEMCLAPGSTNVNDMCSSSMHDRVAQLNRSLALGTSPLSQEEIAQIDSMVQCRVPGLNCPSSAGDHSLAGGGGGNAAGTLSTNLSVLIAVNGTFSRHSAHGGTSGAGAGGASSGSASSTTDEAWRKHDPTTTVRFGAQSCATDAQCADTESATVDRCSLWPPSSATKNSTLNPLLLSRCCRHEASGAGGGGANNGGDWIPYESSFGLPFRWSSQYHVLLLEASQATAGQTTGSSAPTAVSSQGTAATGAVQATDKDGLPLLLGHFLRHGSRMRARGGEGGQDLSLSSMAVPWTVPAGDARAGRDVWQQNLLSGGTDAPGGGVFTFSDAEHATASAAIGAWGLLSSTSQQDDVPWEGVDMTSVSASSALSDGHSVVAVPPQPLPSDAIEDAGGFAYFGKRYTRAFLNPNGGLMFGDGRPPCGEAFSNTGRCSAVEYAYGRMVGLLFADLNPGKGQNTSIRYRFSEATSTWPAAAAVAAAAKQNERDTAAAAAAAASAAFNATAPSPSASLALPPSPSPSPDPSAATPLPPQRLDVLYWRAPLFRSEPGRGDLTATPPLSFGGSFFPDGSVGITILEASLQGLSASVNNLDFLLGLRGPLPTSLQPSIDSYDHDRVEPVR